MWAARRAERRVKVARYRCLAGWNRSGKRFEREVVDGQHARHGRGEGPDIERAVQHVEPVTPG